MTREEAIKYAKSKKMMLESLIYNDDCKYGNYAMYSTELSFVNAVISALRPVSREQVEKVWRGEWKHYLPPLGAGNIQCRCTKCGRTPDVETPFCAWCGAPMTGEAVDILLKRLEELHGRS